jgi:hypothetical protein
MFRDQSQEMEQKFCQRPHDQLFSANENKSSREMADLRGVDSAKAFVACGSPLFRPITPSTGELVVPLFFHYFTVEDTASGYGLLSCLPQRISMAKDDALSAAVLSVGYSLFANITNSPDNLVMARRNYGIAVRLTSDALEKCTPSETCEITRVILLLAFFEVRYRD